MNFSVTGSAAVFVQAALTIPQFPTFSKNTDDFGLGCRAFLRDISMSGIIYRLVVPVLSIVRIRP